MMINVFQPSLGNEELEAVREVFASNWIGRGKVSQKFEAAFAEHLDTYPENCMSISSCTDGLFLSMEVLNIVRGDEVILPSISFHGAGEAVAARNAKPVFCDVDVRTLNPSLQDVINCYHSGRTKAIILLHYGGVPCEDVWRIANFARERNIYLIEDSACSVASTSNERACGTIGHIGIWSFDAMKILSTGDGGMMYFRDPEMRQKAESMAWLCAKSQSGISDPSDVWWQVEIDGVGRRMLMNDVTAAIGLAQLKKLDSFIARRREIVKLYDNCLSELQWLKIPPPIRYEDQSSYYLYWVQLANGKRRKMLANYLRERGIYTTFRYWPLHLMEYFSWSSPNNLIGADHAAQRTLNLPLHQALTDDEVRTICSEIANFGMEQQW